MALRHYLFFLFVSSGAHSVDGMRVDAALQLPDGRLIARMYIFGEHECSPEEWPAVLAASLISVLPNPAEAEQRGVPFPTLRFFYEGFLRELGAVPLSKLPEYKQEFVARLTEKCSLFLAVDSYQGLRTGVAASQATSSPVERIARFIEKLGGLELDADPVDSESEEVAGLHKEVIECLIDSAQTGGLEERAVRNEFLSTIGNLKSAVCRGLVPTEQYRWVSQQLGAILAIATNKPPFNPDELVAILNGCSQMVAFLQNPLAHKDTVFSKEEWEQPDRAAASFVRCLLDSLPLKKDPSIRLSPRFALPIDEPELFIESVTSDLSLPESALRRLAACDRLLRFAQVLRFVLRDCKAEETINDCYEHVAVQTPLKRGQCEAICKEYTSLIAHLRALSEEDSSGED